MDIPDDLQCLFHADVEARGDSYVIEVPARELTTGSVRAGQVYRVGVFPPGAGAETRATGPDSADGDATSDGSGDQRDETAPAPPAEGSGESQRRRANSPAPPVSEGDRRTVDIDDIGEQGDGVARVDRGYVVIVPDTERGERVTIEITDVTETVGFGTVVSRADYYE